MIAYVRNVQGHRVRLQLVEIDPDEVKLDPSNPRIGFSMKQLAVAEQSDPACTLLLTSQEDTEGLKRSIILSGGVQEPVYLRHDYTVAEGNRRIVAMRAAKEEFPADARFQSMPAWLIDATTPESVIQDLLNEIHLGSVRGWAPYEKALQMRSLVKSGLIEQEVAERYRMTANEVRQQIEAANFMDRRYFPITNDPTDPEHRTKFSYFLEFMKGTRLQAHAKTTPELPERFAVWVRDGRINTGARVRRLAGILDSEEATELLDVVGFDAAEEYLAKQNPDQQELYALVEKARARISEMNIAELLELGASEQRQKMMRALQGEIAKALKTAVRSKKAS